MTEIAVYGLPVRMPHWSFGVRYIHQLVRQSMGHSKIFEVMFPGDPCRAFLMDGNSLAENTLVTAHVLGHADFAKNNQLFARFHAMAGGNIVEMAARACAPHPARHRVARRRAGRSRARRGARARIAHRRRPASCTATRYPEFVVPKRRRRQIAFQSRFASCPASRGAARRRRRGLVRAPVPPHPEFDLLWFIANYAPELEQWERDIFLMVRSESFYFYPVFACQIMNEGWASYWHARLLREAEFLPQPLYLSAIKAHSDVVRPFASGQQTALAINPYHLGFTLWEHIVEKHGLEHAREVCSDEDDFGFIRNWLDEELAEKLDLFVYEARPGDEIRVANRDINAIREAILAPKFNFGAPRVAAVELKHDGSLALAHDHASDGRGLDVDARQARARVRPPRVAPRRSPQYGERARRGGGDRCLEQNINQHEDDDQQQDHDQLILLGAPSATSVSILPAS